MGGKKKAPKAPDYQAAATAQAEASKETLAYQNNANRPTQTTPWGKSEWDIDPKTGKATQNVSLNADDQASLSSQQRVGRDLSATAETLTDRVSGDLANPVDYSQFREHGELEDYDTRRQSSEDAAYGRSTSRLDPQWEQRRNDTEVKLASQGLVPGDEAYDRAMGNLDRGQNDAYSTAQQDSVAAGRAESAQSYQQQLGTAEYDSNVRNSQVSEELQKRGWSINEINALISGNEVGMPNLPEFSSSGRAETANILGATEKQYQGKLDRYNSGQAGLSGMFSGLGGIAKAGLSAYSGVPIP